MRGKTKKETSLPISLELAQVIKEQQEYILTELGNHFKYLFCARKRAKITPFIPQPKVMHNEAFIAYLKWLSKEFKIRDNSGNIRDFQPHQFRHTVGTRMVNLGIPLHIIQRYLGHESPTMTMTYPHIHDETLRKEIEKYHDGHEGISQQSTSISATRSNSLPSLPQKQ